jgi:hypothetical protein
VRRGIAIRNSIYARKQATATPPVIEEPVTESNKHVVEAQVHRADTLDSDIESRGTKRAAESSIETLDSSDTSGEVTSGETLDPDSPSYSPLSSMEAENNAMEIQADGESVEMMDFNPVQKMGGGKSGSGTGGGGTSGGGGGLIWLTRALPMLGSYDLFPSTVSKKFRYTVCGFNPFQIGQQFAPGYKTTPTVGSNWDGYCYPVLDLSPDYAINYFDPAQCHHLNQLMVDGWEIQIKGVEVLIDSKGTTTPLLYSSTTMTSIPQNGTLNIGAYVMKGVDRMIKQSPSQVVLKTDDKGVGIIQSSESLTREKRAGNLMQTNYGSEYAPGTGVMNKNIELGADSVFRRPSVYMSELITFAQPLLDAGKNKPWSTTNQNLKPSTTQASNANWMTSRTNWQNHVSVFDAVKSGGMTIGYYNHQLQNCYLSKQDDQERFKRAQIAPAGYVANGVPFVNNSLSGIGSYAIGTNAASSDITANNQATFTAANMVGSATIEQESVAIQTFYENKYRTPCGGFNIPKKIPSFHIGLEPVTTAPGLTGNPDNQTQYVEMEIYVTYTAHVEVRRRHNFGNVPTFAGYTTKANLFAPLDANSKNAYLPKIGKAPNYLQLQKLAGTTIPMPFNAEGIPISIADAGTLPK